MSLSSYTNKVKTTISIKGILIVLLLAMPDVDIAQPNYNEYHKDINKAEVAFFINNNAPAAFQLYDHLLSAYDFVFVKDYFMAAQIACKQHDQQRLNRYLAACFRNGLTMAHLALSPVLIKAGITKQNSKLQSLYNTCRKQYLAKIDWDYLGRIYQIFAEDQIDKGLPRSLYNERLRRHLGELIDMIKAKGFPSDRLVGIDDSSLRIQGRNLVGWYRQVCEDSGTFADAHIGYSDLAAMASCVIIPFLLHHPCTYQKLSPYLADEIRKGNIHPRDVGLLYDNIMRLRTMALNSSLACAPPGKGYFKLNLFCPYPEDWRRDTRSIDELRQTLNICSLSQDSIKKAKGAAYGFYNKFGFWSCR